MNLYLVQHAQAVSKQVDPDRPLSEQGLAEAQRVADFLRPLGVKVDQIWHSGKARAAQTAEILAGAVKAKARALAHESLGPNDDVAALRAEIEPLNRDIMIVGHLPFVSRLASLLLTGTESPPVVSVRNSGVVCLSRPQQDQWQIEWIVTPDILP